MQNPARLKRIVAYMLLLMPVFWILKVAQVGAEHDAIGKVASAGAELVEGTTRRLSNPSFWAIAVCAGAAWLVIRSVVLVGPDKVKAMLTSRFIRGIRLVWMALILVSVGSYLVIIWAKKEAFFYHWGQDPQAYRNSGLMVFIQSFEGLCNVFLILAITAFFPISLAAIEAVRREKAERPPDDPEADEKLQRAASSLASVGLLPVSVAAVALLVHSVTQWIYSWQADWTRPWPFVFKGLASLGLLAWPFLAVTVIARIRLRRHFFFRLQELTLRDLIAWLGESVQALWLRKELPPLLRKRQMETNGIWAGLDFVGAIVPIGLWYLAQSTPFPRRAVRIWPGHRVAEFTKRLRDELAIDYDRIANARFERADLRDQELVGRGGWKAPRRGPWLRKAAWRSDRADMQEKRRYEPRA